MTAAYAQCHQVLRPTGDAMPAGRYVGLVRSLFARAGQCLPCDDGHDDCAAWEGGPCSATALAMVPDEPGERRCPKCDSTDFRARADGYQRCWPCKLAAGRIAKARRRQRDSSVAAASRRGADDE